MPRIPVGAGAAAVVDWLQTHLAAFFDGIAALMQWLINLVLLALTAPHPLVVTALAVGLAFFARGLGLAIFSLAGLLLIQAMNLWTESMVSLAVVIVASFLAIAVGVPTGILAGRNGRFRAGLRPVLDAMQTTPPYVYLIPAVFLFGIGVVPATVATFIFAIPPAIRLTDLGIRQVDPEMVEASTAFGAAPRQVLREVQLPLATPSIMTGVNQVIMMSLAMVVIAGLIGAGGLGGVIVTGISQLDIAAGFEGGLAIVLLAVYLDRVTGAFPRERKRRRTRSARTAQPASESASETAA